MDPLGLSLENFDAVGRWRTVDDSYTPLDVVRRAARRHPFDGVAGLRRRCCAGPDRFVGTLTEKLLTYALGRGLEYYDAPAVRAIVARRRAETTIAFRPSSSASSTARRFR